MLMLPVVIMAIESDEERMVMTKIYQDYRSLMYKIAWKYFRTETDVEDIVSESCREMIKHFSTLCGLERNEMRAYIGTIVRNTSLNFQMKKNRENIVSLDDESYSVMASLESQDTLPEQKVIFQDMLDRVMLDIEKLPVRERDILFLRIKEGREFEEIAMLYKTSPENIRKILERARKHLKATVYGRDKA